MLSKDEYRFMKQKCKTIRRHLNELLPMAEQVEERAPKVTEFAFGVSIYLHDLENELEESVNR
jgi:ribulose 1,5-bisphosphate carboxylase large subunit-like protein